MSVLQSSDQETLHFTWNIQKHSFSFNRNNTKLKTYNYMQPFPYYCNVSIYLGLPWNVSTAEFSKWDHKSVQSLKSTCITTIYSHLTVTVLFTGAMTILTCN